MGERKDEYYVHESLLCKDSPFFTSASKKEWREGQERRIALPDDYSLVIDLYLQWVYSGKIFSRKSPSEEQGEVEKVMEFSLLIGSFLFGEKVQNGDFKDAVIDALIHSVSKPDNKGNRRYPTEGTVDRAYQGTPEGSPLRRLLLDMHIIHGHGKWVEGQTNVEFLAALAGRLLDNKGMPEPQDPTKPNLSSCQYHHHEKEDECYSKRPKQRRGR